MSSTNLPAEATWPDHLFRVTSSLTWRRSSSGYSFTSAVHKKLSGRLRLEEAFPSEIAFKDAVNRHLKASHVIQSGAKFYTPFISTTTSFRYALSVAELHSQRGGTDVKLALIDTRLIGRQAPIWDAEQIADLYHLDRSTDDFKDEFLVFGSLQASRQSFKAVKYLDLVYKLGAYIPDFLENMNAGRARFATFWRDVPRRNEPLKPHEVAAAMQIARFMSTDHMMVAMTLMVVLLPERTSYGMTYVNDIVELIRSNIDESDIDAYFRFVLTASTSQELADSTKEFINVYDYHDEQYHPRQSSASSTMKDYNCALACLCRQLNDTQVLQIRKLFDLSPTALIVRQYTRGHADQVVKCSDRGSGDIRPLNSQVPTSEKLAIAFANLTSEIGKYRVDPLSRLNRLLKEVKSNVPRDEVSFYRRRRKCHILTYFRQGQGGILGASAREDS